MNQRGFTLAHLMVAIVVLGLLAAIVVSGKSYINGVDERGYARGVAETTAKRDAADRKAKGEQEARENAVSAALIKAEESQRRAERQANTNFANWQEAVREAKRNRVPLAGCVDIKSHETGPNVDGPAVGVVRFSSEFVRLFDGAWSGLQGQQPLFPSTGGGAGAAGSGAVTPGDVLDVHGVNAKTCSEDRREFQALINKIRAAEAAWENGVRQ